VVTSRSPDSSACAPSYRRLIDIRARRNRDGNKEVPVMGIKWAVGTSTFASVAATALLAAGLAACSVDTGGSAASPVKTVTATAPASHGSGSAAAASQDNGAAGSSASTAQKLPDYSPATVVSESSTTIVLKSADSVGKVGTFYKSALTEGGWDTTSSSMGPFHASFTAHRGNEGVSVSVYFLLGGSGISISRFPV
jgi:hypothetical protein